jgi:prevent-host-death family protein
MAGFAVVGKAGACTVMDDYLSSRWSGGDMSRAPVWTVPEAKAKFSQVIDQARSGPQTITRNGRPAAVVVSVDEWERRTRQKATLRPTGRIVARRE